MIFLGGREPLLIEDASAHPVTRNLAVTREANIGSYLGVPILLGDGTMFGTLCALDSRPYQFTEREVEVVRKLSVFLAHALDLEGTAASFFLKSTALDSTASAVAISQIDGELLWINQAFTELTGYTLTEARERRISMIGDVEPLEKRRAICQHVSSGEFWQGEVINARKDGSLYHEEVTITPVTGDEGRVEHFIAIKQDISVRKHTEARLQFLAHYDTLTSLPNRVLFRQHLIDEIYLAAREKRELAVLFLDLDRFKNINETLGHNIGDLLLIEVAARIQDCLGDEDKVARISGDEFMILLTGACDPRSVSELTQVIRETIIEPIYLEGYELYISPSVGVTLYPADGEDADTLIKQAETAMHAAKDSGRNTHLFYTSEMNKRSRLELENHLRRALERDELVLHYQPQINLATGAVIGVEALLRWQHPELGLVSPDVFIPIAEEIGLIGPIGDWVLRTACSQNMAWQAAGLPRLCMAVNLSVSQFQYFNLVEQVHTVLQDTGLDPLCLELEITESLIIHNTDKVIEVLHELKKLGIQISVDDFGTGYSSLRYLQTLPLDTLKIDRSFVMDIEHVSDEAAIAKAVIALAHNLGLRVIAEGVETDEQRQFLLQERCDMAQGYFYSRPLPAHELELWLAGYRAG